MLVNIDNRILNLMKPLLKDESDEKEIQEAISLMLITSLDIYVTNGGKGVDVTVLENLKEEYSKRALKRLLSDMLEDE